MKPQTLPKGSDLQPLLDVQQNHLTLLFSQGDSIDAKSLAILASNFALLIFIEQSVGEATFWPLAMLLTPFLLSLVLNLYTIWPRAYKAHSVLLGEHPEYLRMDQDHLILQLIADTREAILVNTSINRKRWRFFVLSLGLTAFGTIVILLYFN